jgi:thrombospondin type 3 repeat protein
MRHLKLIVLGALTVLVLAAPASASARHRDRNHDRIPDRWEKTHKLSLRVNQARRDQDHDGLRNRAEFRAHTDPRKADTDGDGIKDGAEHAGKVASFTGGVLTIDLFGGKTLTGTVDDTTEIECADAHASDAGDQGDDHGDHHGDDPGDDHGEDPGDDDGGDAATSCDMSALTAGAVVKEAELHTVGGDAVFEKVELAG